MGLVLWIDQNTFATGLLEKVFKKKNLPFYTLDSVDDFLYLVEDIKPSMIVLDFLTAKSNPEAFKKQYDALNLNGLSFVLIDAVEGLDFVKNVVGTIKRPFDPFKIPEILQSFQRLN
jgi:DNA-binding NtrC family response regulator